jgi:hypothetical protein
LNYYVLVHVLQYSRSLLHAFSIHRYGHQQPRQFFIIIIILNEVNLSPPGTAAGPIFFIIIILREINLSPLGTAATTGLLCQPEMIYDDHGATGGMKIGRENRSTQRKLAPAPLCPPQIPHDQTRSQNREAAVESQRLAA